MGAARTTTLSLFPPPPFPSLVASLPLLPPPIPPPIHRLARSIFLPLPPHRLPLDTCSSPWIRILLGIQVYIYAAVSIKEGSTYLERSPDPRVVYPNSFDDVRMRVCVCVWRVYIHKMTASTSLSYALRNWLLRGWVSRACSFLSGSAIKGRPLLASATFHRRIASIGEG